MSHEPRHRTDSHAAYFPLDVVSDLLLPNVDVTTFIKEEGKDEVGRMKRMEKEMKGSD